MNSKSIAVLISIFLLQSLGSCICRSRDIITYEVEYNSISIIPWNTSGFNAMEVTDTVYRNAFGLTLSANFEPRKVSHSKNNFGFSTSLACSQDGDIYKYSDPIEFAEIYVTDIANNKKQNVTNSFGAYGYSDELISLSELFAIREEWHDGFQFELIEFDSIPSSAVFTVHLYLESGIKFSESTKQINFYD